MKKTTLSAAVIAATLITSNVNASESNIQHLTIVPDLSGSGSLLTNDNFANAVIRHVTQKISTLNKGAWVEIRPFGDGRFNSTNRKIRISSKGATVDYVSNLVATTLNEIRTQAGDGQNSTNLLAFLELEELHCDTGSSHIYLLSDAIEHSVDVSGETLLNGSQALPKPNEGLLKGCKVTIIGLGNVSGGLLPRKQRRNLEKAWRDWFAQAGIDAIDIIYRP